jgi:outer membrane protein OmpA-like peptidoglycan-associated protein
MSIDLKRSTAKFAFLFMAAGLMTSIGVHYAGAAEQARSSSQIIDALKPKVSATRSLTVSPADAAKRAEETKFVDTLRKRTTRSLTTDERDKIASIAKEKPSVDLEINFDYNSDKISSAAGPQVTALGQALSSEDLKGGTFVLAGHTDAKGSETFNQGLSERRADAVKRYLMAKYHLDSAHLVTVGYGKTQLKDPQNPTAAENRRVQVVNMAN